MQDYFSLGVSLSKRLLRGRLKNKVFQSGIFTAQSCHFKSFGKIFVAKALAISIMRGLTESHKKQARCWQKFAIHRQHREPCRVQLHLRFNCCEALIISSHSREHFHFSLLADESPRPSCFSCAIGGSLTSRRTTYRVVQSGGGQHGPRNKFHRA